MIFLEYGRSEGFNFLVVAQVLSMDNQFNQVIEKFEHRDFLGIYLVKDIHFGYVGYEFHIVKILLVHDKLRIVLLAGSILNIYVKLSLHELAEN